MEYTLQDSPGQRGWNPCRYITPLRIVKHPTDPATKLAILDQGLTFESVPGTDPLKRLSDAQSYCLQRTFTDDTKPPRT